MDLNFLMSYCETGPVNLDDVRRCSCLEMTCGDSSFILLYGSRKVTSAIQVGSDLATCERRWAYGNIGTNDPGVGSKRKSLKNPSTAFSPTTTISFA